ncbi:inactive ubiquitin carboxyl-terminal hydrolase MINDY-4B isoform X2 [Numida meleagris]|uniref:inactive ubiquitin carboxyl-terminal hydrolase MINDY-4B isoform X2 n=1 Tax=Numida meleagris TaxID=8996 RepID=UPI000B3E3422|nr:inactive ubiquitin carboxyl-terminal hydrolase MINDY-4B isoform X2 [Numida meleagris]
MTDHSPLGAVQAACRQGHDVHSVRSTPRCRRPSGAIAALYLQALRTLLLGNASRTFSQDWARAHFRFREPRSELAYTLEAEKGGTRAIVMAVQANIIKYLLFVRNTEHTHLERSEACFLGAISGATVAAGGPLPMSGPTSELGDSQHPQGRTHIWWPYGAGRVMWTRAQGHRGTDPRCPCPHLPGVLCSTLHCRLCKISQKEQGEALAAALADSLWAAGDGRGATVCLLAAATRCSAPLGCKADSFTERIHLFEFREKAAAQEFLFDHIDCFRDEGSHGLILFLYSLLFSRTLERVREELGGTAPHLLECSSGNVTCTQAVLLLVLAGSAQPRQRSEVGFLRWGGEEAERRLPPVGSMLKTPKFPIWLCSINGTHSVLFSTNRLLLSDWKMEHVFHLYFYNGQHRQTRTAHLTVDTHSHHWEEGRCEAASRPGRRAPSLEMAIRTKWPGAAVSWNGTEPFF